MGRSVLALSAATLAVSVAILASTLGASSIVSAQTTAEPQRPALTEAEQYAAAQRNAAIYRGLYDPADPSNPFPGKYYRDLTAEDFQRLPPREADVVIVSALHTYSKEYYDLVDSIKPTAMTREQFLHVLLRETARRDIIHQVLNGTGYVPRSVANQSVTISRPLDVPPAQRTSATIAAVDAVYRDLAISLLQNPRRVEVVMERDIGDQVGLHGRSSIVMDIDMSAFMAGYTAGANPNFFNGNQAGSPAGPLPLTIGFASDVTVAQLREAYCAIVPAIVQSGRARGVDQNLATSAGFLMAREDAANGFASNDTQLAFRGEQCPATPVPWDHQTMGRAITGIDVLP